MPAPPILFVPTGLRSPNRWGAPPLGGVRWRVREAPAFRRLSGAQIWIHLACARYARGGLLNCLGGGRPASKGGVHKGGRTQSTQVRGARPLTRESVNLGRGRVPSKRLWVNGWGNFFQIFRFFSVWSM